MVGWLAFPPGSAAQPQSVGADAQLPPAATEIVRIAFGSCLRQDRPQPIWADITAARPQLMLMMGDNVYGDFNTPDAKPLADAYAMLARNPDFASARRTVPMLAIWDDHDYGMNDAGASFPYRLASAQLFHRFWGFEMQRAAIDGIHYSRTFGPAGRRVQIIMLDTRTLRSDLRRKTSSFQHWGAYEPDADPGKTMLGEEQWAWLEQQLLEPADLRILVSSIQVLAEGHGWERWGNFPRERAKLIALLERLDARNTILLSGDRHAGAFYRQAHGRLDLLEVTSSSLNAPPRGPMRDTRMPPLVSELFIEENFGLIDIDWRARRATISLMARGGRELARQTRPITP